MDCIFLERPLLVLSSPALSDRSLLMEINTKRPLELNKG